MSMMKLTPTNIDRILDEIEIPTLPSIASAIMEKTLDDWANAKNLTSMVEKDTALAAKVLKVANSPFYHRIKEISTIRSAVVLLGMNVLRSIVLSISVINLFNSHKKNAIDLYRFWQHSISCAVCARMIAAKTLPACEEDAFAAGLLHDIGKIVLDQNICLNGEYRDVIESVNSGTKDIIKAETSIIGINHAELGKKLIEKWNLPKLLCEAVGAHHKQPEVDMLDARDEMLCAIVNIADKMTNHLGLGISIRSADYIDPAVLAKAGLGNKELQEISVSLKDSVIAISDELGIPKIEPKTYFEILQAANTQLGKMSVDVEQKKLALERRTIELTGLNRMSSQLQSSMKLSEITEILTSNALTIMGSSNVRCLVRLSGLRIMFTESVIENGNIVNRSGIASATKEILDRTQGIYPKSGGIIHAPLKVESSIIGVIESIPIEDQHEDITEKTLLLRTIAEVGGHAIERAALVAKNLKAERLAAVSKTAIAANHEINSPLTTILLKLDILLREKNVKTEYYTTIKEVKDEASKIKDLVKRMLEISDVVETDYLKHDSKTEKMLDMKTSTKKQESASEKNSEPVKPESDTPGFEDYLE
jgi:putative nucleotidyltransferase with HDIG domain